MRKFIITGVMAIVAMLAIPSLAAAKVERCATTTVTDSGPKTATFTVNQPKDNVTQFTNVWRHEYEVALNADGSFFGTGKIYDNGATDTTWTETVTGSLNADGTLNMQTTPVGGGATFKVTNALMNSTTVTVDTNGTWSGLVEFQIGAPTITGGSVITTIEYKN